MWYDTTTATAWVCGSRLGKPIVLSIVADGSIAEQALVSPDSALTGHVIRFSRNGKWCSGNSTLPGPITEGVVWKFGAWDSVQTVGSLPGSSSLTTGSDISDGGICVGVSACNPYKWTESTGITMMPSPANSAGCGIAGGISSDGSTIIGSGMITGGVFSPWIWTNSGTTVRELEDPFGVNGITSSISPNGVHIGGYVYESSTQFACAWLNGGPITLIQSEGGGNLPGEVWDCTNDGFYVGWGLFGSTQQAFVWHTSWGSAKRLSDWLFEQTGLSSFDSLRTAKGALVVGDSYMIAVQTDSSGCFIKTPTVAASVCCSLPGDADGSGRVNIGDIAFLIGTIFRSSPSPDCFIEGDVNRDFSLSIGDVTLLVATIFTGGVPPQCR